MKKADVIAIYEAELARCVAAPAAEDAEVNRLLASIDERIEGAKAINDTDAEVLMRERRQGVLARRAEPRKSPEYHAWQGTRTRVQAILQEGTSPPTDAEDVDDLHAAQKRHFKDLWKEADRLVRDAGITEGGRS